MNKARAIVRTALGLGVVAPLIIVGAAVQTVYGAVTGDQKTIPNMIYNSLRALLGYKIEFNKASAPVVKDKPVWFVANHMSNADFVVLGSKLNGTFAGKGDVLKWPVVAQLARAVKYIGLRRTKEFNPQSRAKIARNFNAGHNTIMFPEGTTSEGSQVYQFRAALPGLLYGQPSQDDKNRDVPLQRDVVVQPVAIRVMEVEGENAVGNSTLRDLYSMEDNPKFLSRIWKRFHISTTKIEITVFPPMDPKSFSGPEELMNAAALQVASVVNPGQKTFERSKIPQTMPPKG